MQQWRKEIFQTSFSTGVLSVYSFHTHIINFLLLEQYFYFPDGSRTKIRRKCCSQLSIFGKACNDNFCAESNKTSPVQALRCRLRNRNAFRWRLYFPCLICRLVVVNLHQWRTVNALRYSRSVMKSRQTINISTTKLDIHDDPKRRRCN